MFKAKIKALQYVKTLLLKNDEELVTAKRKAFHQNAWFTPEQIDNSISAITNSMLGEAKLEEWLCPYEFHQTEDVIGLIPAGNIPLVGFHDLLCCFVLNVHVRIKLSSKDEHLMRYMIGLLQEADPAWKVEIIERLQGFNKVIATGSNNTHRYFEQYFGKVPSLLRKDRSSIAVLDGNETEEELNLLADDIFQYFGLGCRNVSQVWVPKGYDVTKLFAYFKGYEHYRNHKQYTDNYDYNRTLLLMNQIDHLSNDEVMLKEDESLHARIATIHYQYYDNDEIVANFIDSSKESLQCIVGHNFTPFGKAQQPELWDYADDVDTLAFLLGD